MTPPRPTPPRRIVVLSNKGSGRNKREAGAIDAAMGVLGERATLWRVDGDELEEAARRALRDGFDAVVAAGGDGTVMGVAGAVAGTGRPFGVLPLGTFNYFARGLGIAEDPREAARVILGGHTRPVALGEVNGQLFLNNVSVGIYPSILRAREAVYARWGRRRLAAHWSALKTFARFQRPLFLTIRADGEERRARTPLLFVARSAYQLDSFGLAGSGCVARGRLAVFVAPDSGRMGLVHKAWRLVRRRMAEGRDFELLCTDAVSIAARSRHLTVACDGEKFRMRTPLRLRVRPDALQVFAPEAAATADAAGAAA